MGLINNQFLTREGRNISLYKQIPKLLKNICSKIKMKYIFRYTILTAFPHPDNKITKQQLSEALQSVNFQSSKYSVSHLQQLSLTCIQKILTRPQQKVLSVIEDSLNPQNNKLIPEFNPKQLQTIWEQEKVNVYKSVLQGACSSGSVYKDIQWSVKNIIMRRGQALNKGNSLITKLNINCLENPAQPQNKTQLTVTLNKKGVQKMYNSLVDCQNAINELLMSEE